MKSPSRLAWFFCSVFILLVSFGYYPKWNKKGTEALLSWDAYGYYIYLPAVFIHHDLKDLRFGEGVIKEFQPTIAFDQAFRPPGSNHYVLKYSSGMALQELPFFMAAHALAKPLGYPANGLSEPYQFAIQLGGVLVGLLGLALVRRALVPRFGEWPAALTMIVLVLGSNYLEYAAIGGAMTHIWLFTWYAVLLTLTPSFYRRPTMGRAVAIGAVVGIMTLTRPTEILATLLPLCWGLRPTAAAFRERFLFWGRYWPYGLWALVGGAAFVLVQPLYWHYASGNWIVYSYQDQGFSWLRPHLWEGLFSYRAGWLLYSPLLFTALFGFGALRRQVPEAFWAMLVFTILFIYVTFAWDIWWYGGSLGQRAMVQSYAVLAWPMAAALRWLLARPKAALAYAVMALLGFYYNIWMTHQAHRGGLLTGEMSRAYFWHIVGRYNVSRNARLLLDSNSEYTGSTKDTRVLLTEDFEQQPAEMCATPALAGKCSLVLDKDHQNSPDFSVDLKPGDVKWLRASVQARTDEPVWNTWDMTQLFITFRKGDKVVKEKSVRLQRALELGWASTLPVDIKAPQEPYDRVTVKLWHPNTTRLVVDELRLEAFPQ
ncbi:hypothetical protein [Hymenobacter mucosus]|uniref:Dolichyl-phosphate-mannose-protein mannosyltransferase n=1 Tax=Hymenobacter mucosus TaxID=1411120 RepID=A0A238W0X6_9BACT|nr:hypothetical protein [Hymenobacter mucosus]SNR40166.1 hypothetical protein SAMN06269173_102123 [Hymenobacter mucosus]